MLTKREAKNVVVNTKRFFEWLKTSELFDYPVGIKSKQGLCCEELGNYSNESVKALVLLEEYLNEN
jgi:hypothetical protein